MAEEKTKSNSKEGDSAAESDQEECECAWRLLLAKKASVGLAQNELGKRESDE